MKVKASISTNKVGSTDTRIFEFDDEEWESMNDDERSDLMWETMIQYVNYDWEVVE